MNKLLALVFCISTLGRAEEKYIYKIKEFVSNNDLITVEQSEERDLIEGFNTKGYNYTITINSDITEENDLEYEYFFAKTEDRDKSSLCNVDGENLDGLVAKIALRVLGLNEDQLSCPISATKIVQESVFRADINITDFLFEGGASADLKLIADDFTLEVTIARTEHGEGGEGGESEGEESAEGEGGDGGEAGESEGEESAEGDEGGESEGEESAEGDEGGESEGEESAEGDGGDGEEASE